MGITNLYITRHGQTEWNVQGRLQGHLDSPLTESGIIQAEQLGDSLVDIGFDAIYSSPSLRTVRTAEMIRGERAIDINIEDKLREIYMGSWEGMELNEVKLQFPHEHEAYWNTPDLYVPSNGGETFAVVSQRAVSCIEKIIRDNENKTILLVTHTVTLKSIMNYFERRPLQELWNPPYVHPTSLSHVTIEDGVVTIEKYGDMTHIDEKVH